jgi:ribonuclease-3
MRRMDALDALEERVPYRFRERDLLEAALTHRSMAHGAGGKVAHYERLETLGDALVGFVVLDHLFKSEPEAAEGELTRRRAALVRTENLARAALDLGLDRLARTVRGLEVARNPSLLADTFEALVGAVYVDGGIRPARRVVRRWVPGLARAGSEPAAHHDAKTALQEATQRRWHVTPTYLIVRTTGPAHAPEFVVEARLGAEAWGTGAGRSRREAEQEAARAALRRLEHHGP